MTVLILAYIVNENLMTYHEQTENTCSVILLISATLFVYIFDFGFLIFQFIEFGDSFWNVVLLLIVVVFWVLFTLGIVTGLEI